MPQLAEVFLGEGPTKFAVINANGIQDNTIVSGVPGKKIRVISYTATADGNVTATWKSGTTAITGAMAITSAETHLATCYLGCFETAEGEDLVITTDAAQTYTGHLTYVEVD